MIHVKYHQIKYQNIKVNGSGILPARVDRVAAAITTAGRAVTRARGCGARSSPLGSHGKAAYKMVGMERQE
jgi:hypothetical protein